MHDPSTHTPPPSPRVDALTLDQFNAIRSNNSAPPSKWKPRVAAPTNIVRPVFDLDGHALSVAHVDDTMTMRFEFDGATADLSLVEAKRLAVSLTDALNAWRDTMTNTRDGA